MVNFFLFAFLFGSVASFAGDIPAEACRQLAEYRPGVDVHGKPVVPADLEEPAVTLPQTYSFDVTVDVAESLGIATPVGAAGDLTVGTITVEKGKVLFNGNPVDTNAAAALRAQCDKPEEKEEKSEEKPATE